MSAIVNSSGLSSSIHNIEEILSEDSSDMLQRLKAIYSEKHFKADAAFTDQIRSIEAVDLSNLLNRFFSEMIKEERIGDPIAFLERLNTLIPIDKLQEAVKDNIPNANALEEAKQMFEEANLYIQMTNGNHSPSCGTRLSSILKAIVTIIESIVMAFGIGDFFKPAESDIHADFKSQKIMMLLSLFSMITTILLPTVGVAIGGMIIGSILFTLVVLSVIWPFIKPLPNHLPANAENWTEEVRQGNFFYQGRKESLDAIANTLKMGRHSILVGPSRVGKSLTAKAFAHAVETGAYPELKGKVFFRINTADLVGQQASFLGGGNDILKKISAAMGRHSKDIVLVLDEMHMACKNGEKIADQLKTFLDEGGLFPHVIGITTEEEYNKHIKDNNAFSLRFDKIDITNTDKDETIKILCDTYLRSHARPMVKEGVFKHIYDKTTSPVVQPGTPTTAINESSVTPSAAPAKAAQPSASLKLLKRCINLTSATQVSPTKQKILQLANKISSLRLQSVAEHSRKQEIRKQIAQCETEKNDLQTTLEKEEKELAQLFRSKELLDRVTQETYSSIIKVSAIGQEQLSGSDEKAIKRFLLLDQFFSRSLRSHIETTGQRLGVKMVIDESLVNVAAV